MRHNFTFFSCLMALILPASIEVSFAQMGQFPAKTKVEIAREKAGLRHNCRLRSKEIVPKLSSAEFMKNSPRQNENRVARRKKAFLTCLKLSDLKTLYTPDLATLKRALPQTAAATTTTAAAPIQETALTIKVNEAEARIRILNINPVYQDKIALKPGLYHIRVEKQGFKRWDKWIKIKGKNYLFKVKLTALDDSQTTTTSTRSPAVPKFSYAKRRPNPMATPAQTKTDQSSLAEQSAQAARKRAERVAFIKAAVAAKRAKQAATSENATPEELAFQQQVQKNRVKLERGLKLLAAQKKLNAQMKSTAP